MDSDTDPLTSAGVYSSNCAGSAEKLNDVAPTAENPYRFGAIRKAYVGRGHDASDPDTGGGASSDSFDESDVPR